MRRELPTCEEVSFHVSKWRTLFGIVKKKKIPLGLALRSIKGTGLSIFHD